MKQHKKFIMRVATGLVLVVLAGLLSYIIRDVLASRNPISALPMIEVKYINEDSEIPQENCLLASYSWRFVNKTTDGALEDPGQWRDLPPFPAIPGASLDVQFSFPAKSIRVSRWHKDREDKAEVLTGPLTTPFTGGIYTYRVEAEWGARGSVQYYFRVKVN